MLSEDLRRRIAALNREALKHVPQAEKADNTAKNAVHEGSPSLDGRHEKRPSVHEVVRSPSATSPPSPYQKTVWLDEVVRGQVIEEKDGPFLLIERTLRDLWKQADAFQQRYQSAVLDGRACMDSGTLHGDMQKLMEWDRRKVLYIDIETTGLSGSPLFLVGTMRYAEDALMIQQLFARDYSEEPHLLRHLMKCMNTFQVLVSFNGKAFDLPYIRDRSVLHRVPFHHDPFHLDLLHEARRRWREHLPDCRLQTLERVICHRVRMGDLPGSEIPQVYHDFVRTGNAVRIRDILHHNALDLITMSEVLVFMLENRELAD